MWTREAQAAMDKEKVEPIPQLNESNEDESENTCQNFPITMVISYTGTIVCGIVTIMICLKSFNLVTHKLMCTNCLEETPYSLKDEQWIKIQRLFALLVGQRCKEYATFGLSTCKHCAAVSIAFNC